VERSTQATELARQHGWTEEPTVAVAYLTLGVTRVWQMRLEEAEPLLDQAELALRPEVQPAAGLVLRQARGMLALAQGRDADALAALLAAERLAGLLVTEHPAAMVMRADMLQVLLRLGETERVEQALARMNEQEHERGEMRIVAALRLIQDEPRAAAAALAPVLDGSAPVTNCGWVIQAFLLHAIACDSLGDPAAAGRALDHALDLAEPDRAVFAFVLSPAPELLRRHAGHRTAHAALISEILNLLSPQGGLAGWNPPSSGEVGRGRPLTDPLTDSETRVLRYLPTNLSAPEIARQLSVSVNTVRTHMRHVYEKLGAHRRAGAVERARALGLLAPSSRSA
jgi:LuxR family maltose regulon positive regulatory protein